MGVPGAAGEDNPDLRALSLDRLRLLGHRVVEADSGPAALAILETGLSQFSKSLAYHLTSGAIALVIHTTCADRQDLSATYSVAARHPWHVHA